MNEHPPFSSPGAAIVTGGAQGIGLAIAKKLLSDGHPVALWDISEEGAALAAQELSGSTDLRIFPSRVDVSDPKSVAEAYMATLTALGPVTILVNNAGISGGKNSVLTLPLEQWKRVLNVNLNGTFICSQAVLPDMLENGYGRIVNIASIAGKEGSPFNADYAASKAAMISLTKSMGKEFARQGIIVNAVTPSAADTAIFEKQSSSDKAILEKSLLSLVPMGRYVEVEEVAELVSWLASEKCSFSTGSVFDITGGRATY